MAGDVSELFVEMLSVRQSNLGSNLLHRQVGGLQQQLGAIDARLKDISRDGFAHTLLELFGKIVLTELNLLSQFLNT